MVDFDRDDDDKPFEAPLNQTVFHAQGTSAEINHDRGNHAAINDGNHLNVSISLFDCDSIPEYVWVGFLVLLISAAFWIFSRV